MRPGPVLPCLSFVSIIAAGCSNTVKPSIVNESGPKMRSVVFAPQFANLS